MSKSFIGFSESDLNKVFPYFLILNTSLEIEKYGKGFFKLFSIQKNTVLFSNLFELNRPVLNRLDATNIEVYLGKLLVFSLKEKSSLQFKGHIEYIDSIAKYVFFGTLALNSMQQLEEHNISINDFSLNDSLVDLLYVIKNNEIVNEELKEAVNSLNTKKTELQLFRDIISSTSDAIQVCYEDGKMKYINLEASKRIGIAMKDIEKYTVFDFEAIFKDKPEAWAAHVKHLKSVDFLIVEGANFNKTENISIPVEVTVKHIELGGVGHIVAISRDISERKASQKNLEIQEEKYRNIISNMNLGLVEVDLEGNVVMCNSSFEKLAGYSFEEMKGKHAPSLFSRGKFQELLNQKNTERKTVASDSYEVLVRNKRGDAKWWLISGATNFNDKGEVIGSVGIHLDITEQKKLEKDLEIALLKAQKASQAKESFLANMSHEIRTPLNGILGMIEALSLEELNEKQQSFLNSASIASGHLLSVINNVLDITKIEAGELELSKTDFSLEKLLRDVELILKNQVRNNHFELIIDIQGVAPALVGDEIRLRQVLINILGNAIKFTEKGYVKMCCFGEAVSNGKQKIKIEIIDTGVGIGEKSLSKIFEKFQQEDASIARKFGGTGLGLVIAKELIELMEGTISLESKKGSGTQVTICLNLPVGEKDALSENEEFTQYKDIDAIDILLVEDNQMNRLVVQQVLSKTNATIKEVTNGKEAIKYLEKNTPDLILMDVQMPIMGGMEATEIIRKDLQLDIPIIALSANALKSEIDACMLIGFNDYITKPFDRNTLLKSIHKCCVNQNQKNTMNKDNAQKLYSLNELKQIAMGDTDFMQKMIGLFLEITPKSVGEIQEALKRNDIEKIKSIAHKIKPSIDNMGILSLKDLVRNIEKYEQDENNFAAFESQIALLTTTLQKVVEQLKENEL